MKTCLLVFAAYVLAIYTLSTQSASIVLDTNPTASDTVSVYGNSETEKMKKNITLNKLIKTSIN